MPDRVTPKDIIRRLSERMNTDESTAKAWLEGVTETLYEAIRDGSSVTLPGLGGFYVRPGYRSWVFRFNPSQRLRALFGWSSTYKGEL